MAGFTLIELLVAVGLMVMIMGIVAAIFSQTSQVYTHSIDRINIYAEARTACDQMTTDLNGCLPLDSQSSLGGRLVMIDGQTKKDEKKGRSYDMDEISFRTTTSVLGTVRGVEVTYKLVEDTDAMILAEAAKGGRGTTTKTQRYLYALRREIKDLNGTSIDSADLCHYVLSFNVEYFDSATRQFRQINEYNSWPIGDNNPSNETLISAVRISLRVVAGAAERQERLIRKVIWIPMGQ